MWRRGTSESKCRQLEFSTCRASFADRIGGNEPTDTFPLWTTPFTQFVCTVELLDFGKSLTIFFGGDKEDFDGPYSVAAHSNMVLENGPVVHGIMHETRPPCPCPKFASTMESMALRFGPVQSDLVSDGSGAYIPSPESKLGGEPLIVQPGLMREKYEELKSNGFFHFLQLQAPDCIKYPTLEDCPWDPCVLNVFLSKVNGANRDLRFVLQD